MTASCVALVLVLIVWLARMGSDDPGRTERIVEVYARQMDYPAGEAWVRDEALDWADEVCGSDGEIDAFVRHVTSSINDLIEVVEAACPDRAPEFRRWKAENPDL